MEKTYKRVPFDIELAKKIQSGEIEGRIVTSKLNNRVRILCDDLVAMLYPDFRMLCAILRNGQEYVLCFRLDGTTTNTDEGKLVIELPEEAPKHEFKNFKKGDVVKVTPQVGKHSEWIIGFGPVIARVICQASEGVLLENEGSFIDMFSLDEIKYITDAAHDSNHEFKPFDKVLVRESDTAIWRAALYSHTDPYEDGRCVTTDWAYYEKDYIIPYEGNEHLVGTTNNPE